MKQYILVRKAYIKVFTDYLWADMTMDNFFPFTFSKIF